MTRFERLRRGYHFGKQLSGAWWLIVLSGLYYHRYYMPAKLGEFDFSLTGDDNDWLACSIGKLSAISIGAFV